MSERFARTLIITGWTLLAVAVVVAPIALVAGRY